MLWLRAVEPDGSVASSLNANPQAGNLQDE
jgi:hypothetical protein